MIIGAEKIPPQPHPAPSRLRQHAAPIVFGFSPIFGPHSTIRRNVIGFSITFGPDTTIRRNVIGFSITFGPDTTIRRNVIGFSITFGPRTYPNNAKTAHSTI
ncbi:hypothetical protein MKX42_10465 [Paenibacillus sp. FSL R7-0204]|uniref:hypothetical protein n=1 Tax=Paenibacillus sp. FSL R7-0204 TaxID=2921675 RepID=UPI0030F89A0A